MFDNLRDNSGAKDSYGEVAAFVEPQRVEKATQKQPAEVRLLGMTAPQRLLIAALLMVVVCVLGTMCLLVTGRIGAL
jgi:hypothetical protein